MAVNDLRKSLRGIDGNFIIVLAAHDGLTGKATSAHAIDEDEISSWNEDTKTTDFNEKMFVISS